MTISPIVIVGAGMAAYTVARELRKLDKTVPLSIVSKDGAGFYSKPMLSNAFAQNKQAQQLLTQSAEQMAATLQAELIANTEVLSINPLKKTITTTRGQQAYSKLVLALGAQPIRLRLEGDAAEQVLSVNHINDYIVFREKLAALGAGARVAILGAGLIGCEFADDLAGAGYAVSLADLNTRPMALLASPALSSGLQQALQARGVQFHLGASATKVEHAGAALQVSLSDGTSFHADMVLSAVGLRPDTALAQAAGIKTGRGILVDAFGKTSDADIFALGDCAEYSISADGSTAILPYIAPIMAAGRAIARTLAGEELAIEHKATAVIIKTPSYPLAVLPPAHQAQGEWRDEVDGARTISRFVSPAQVVLGFGLAPQEAGLRNSLLAQVGKTL